MRGGAGDDTLSALAARTESSFHGDHGLLSYSYDANFDGSDTIDVRLCLNCADKVITGGGGDDVISIGRLRDDYDGEPEIDLGDGDDTITIDVVEKVDYLKIYGGDGDDNMHVKYIDFEYDAIIEGGAGDDTITVDSYNGNGKKASLSLLGGGGDDVCTLEGTMLTDADCA